MNLITNQKCYRTFPWVRFMLQFILGEASYFLLLMLLLTRFARRL